MADPLAPSFFKTTKAMLLCCFLFAAVLVLGLLSLNSFADSRGDNLIIGEVTMLGTSIGRYHGTPKVQVRLPDGSIQNLTVEADLLAACKVGAKIEIQDFLGKYRVSPKACAFSENVSDQTP